MIKKNWTNQEIENDLVKLLILNCSHLLSLNLNNTKTKKSEAPDFIVFDNHSKVGIEITRAMDQNLKKAIEINGQIEKPNSFSPSNFENRSMTKKEILSQLKKEQDMLISIPYEGKEMEEIVLSQIIKCIERKNKKFHTYKKFKQNFLLIHAEKRPSPFQFSQYFK